MAIDTLKMAKRLREAGFDDAQAEAVVATVQESAEGADLATKSDLDAAVAVLRAEIAELRAELKAEIADLRTEMRMEIAAVRSEMREMELRFDAKLEALKSEILNRMFALILGAIVVNAVALVGGLFAVAKLLAH